MYSVWKKKKKKRVPKHSLPFAWIPHSKMASYVVAQYSE